MSTVLVSRQEARPVITEVSTRRGPEGGQLAWHPCAPPQVAEAEAWDDGTPGWAAWVEHLTNRSWPKRPPAWSAKRPPLFWGLARDDASSESVELIATLHARPSAARTELIHSHLHAWLAEHGRAEQGAPEHRDAKHRSAAGCHDAAFALECLAWCHALPRLAASIRAESWWELLRSLLHAARAIAPCDHRALDPSSNGSSTDEVSMSDSPAPWPRQLLAVELPLTLAWLFPELEPCRRLAAEACREFNAVLIASLDKQELPRAAYLSIFPSLLASWTRTLLIGRNLDGSSESDDHDEKFATAVRHALRMVRRDGGLACPRERRDHATAAKLEAGHVSGSMADALAAAVNLIGDDELAALAAGVLGQPSLRPPKATTSKRLRSRTAGRSAEPVRAGASSTDSEIAILRCDWRRGSPLLLVNYSGPAPSLELSAGRDVLMRGPMETTLRADGQPLALDGDWENICWESDEQMDYLELERELPGGVRVQRQFLLAREARLLLIADAVVAEAAANVSAATALAERERDTTGQGVTGPHGPSWEYCLRLPLADGASFEAAAETREGRIHAQARAANVLPVALGEWKADGRSGGLTARGAHVEFRLAATGRSFYAPLVLDLDARRLGRPLTWRRLTVGENRRIQPADAAAAFRFQLGREQWVLYRSLTGPANRTLLGLNVYHEFLLGRFQRDGECQAILEIEPA